MLFAANAFAATSIYWLRGNDLSGQIEGGTYNLLSSTQPSSASKETLIQKTVQTGTGEIARWYTQVFFQDFILSGKVYFWASGLELWSGKSQYRVALYDFDEQADKSTLIAASKWAEIRSPPQETQIEITKPYIIKSQNRLKLSIEYNSASLNSIIKMAVDEPQAFQETEWQTPIGTKFSAFGVKNTAAILLEICLESSIACSDDAGCSDGQGLTTDTCLAPGTCSAKCEYRQCETKCISDAQCADENPLTSDTCSGIAQCGAACKNSQCSVSCKSSSDCSDSNPNTKDECAFAGTCFAECKNTGCMAWQNCSAQEPRACGDGVCEYGELCDTDCLQNNIELIGIKDGEYYLFGEEINVQAKISGPQKPAKVAMSGFFGEKELLDSGTAPDEKANDGIYSGSFAALSPNSGSLKVTISSYMQQGTTSIAKYFEIAPFIDVRVVTGKKTYFPTETIFITASAGKKGKPVAVAATAAVSEGGQEIFRNAAKPNEFGVYVFSYKASSLDRQGELKIVVSAADEFNNSGTATATVFLSGGGTVNKGLFIEAVFIPKEFSKNQPQKIQVKVKDENGLQVRNASVQAQLAGKAAVELSETQTGIYEGIFSPAETDPSGWQAIKIRAKKQEGGKEQSGEFEQAITIKPLALELEIFGVEKNLAAPQEAVQIKIAGKIGQRAVPLKTVVVMLNGKTIESRKENNFELATLFLDENSPGEAVLFVNATDEYGNTGSKKILLAKSGHSIQYLFSQNILPITGILGAIAAIIAAAAYFYYKSAEKQRLKKRENEIIKELAKLQKTYFEGGLMPRQEYDKKIVKLETELKILRKKTGEKK